MNVMRHFFAICFLFVIASTIVVNVSSKAGIQFPEWTGMNHPWLVLEDRPHTELPQPNVQDILSGNFQEQTESYLADSMPVRDEALLAHAMSERAIIGASAKVFGYDLYPTFYGSYIYYWKSENMLIHRPLQEYAELECIYNTSAESINAFSERHPELYIVVCDIEPEQFSDFNPIHDLVLDSVGREYLRKVFHNLLDEDIAKVEITSASEEELVQRFYRSDHHMRTEYCYDVYLQCIKALDPDHPAVEAQGFFEVKGVQHMGSYARQALMPLHPADELTDISYKDSPLSVQIGEERGGPELLVRGRDIALQEQQNNDYYNAYCHYFHDNFPEMVISNEKAPRDEALLIVHDSNTVPVERLFAEHYRMVYCIDFRYYDGTIEDALEDSGAQDVLIILGDSEYKKEELIAFLK